MMIIEIRNMTIFRIPFSLPTIKSENAYSCCNKLDVDLHATLPQHILSDTNIYGVEIMFMLELLT